MTTCPYCNRNTAYETDIVVTPNDAGVNITYTCPDCGNAFNRMYVFSGIYDKHGVCIDG